MCAVFDSRADKITKKRVRAIRPALEFGVKLAAEHKRVIVQLHDLDQALIGAQTAETCARSLEIRAVAVIELKAVAVALIDRFGLIGAGGFGTGDRRHLL